MRFPGPSPRPPRPESGMTLLEVILAISVAGFVLAAAAGYVVSVANIWSDREERNFFQDHVDGVTEYLRASFAEAGVEIALENSEDGGDGGDAPPEDENGGEPPPPEGEIVPPDDENGGGARNAEESEGAGLVRRSEDPVAWARPPGFADYRQPLLNFKRSLQQPLLVARDVKSELGVDCFLQFDPDDGLSLLWYSTLQEEVEDERDLRRSPISPLVKELRYVYWDERFEEWEETDEPKEGDGQDQYLLPRYLKLVFEYEGVTTERTLAIPIPSQSALIF